MNLELGRQLPTDYNPTVKENLALKFLARRSEPRAQLDRATREFALAWNQRTRAAIESTGAELTGDLDDLPTSLSAAPGPGLDESPGMPEDYEILAAAADAVPAMQRLLRRHTRRLRKQGVELESAPHPDTSVRPDRWDSADDPVGAAAAELADLASAAIVLKRRLRALQNKG